MELCCIEAGGSAKQWAEAHLTQVQLFWKIVHFETIQKKNICNAFLVLDMQKGIK